MLDVVCGHLRDLESADDDRQNGRPDGILGDNRRNGQRVEQGH